MSLGSGSIALRRLQVLVPPEKTPFQWILDRVNHNLVQPIAFDEVREESSGWCHPFSGEPDLQDARDLVFDNAFVFGFRTDTKKVPGTLYRLQLKAALAILGRDETGNPRKVPKKMRDAARDRIKMELLKHTLPAIQMFEVVWHLESNEIWLVTSSKAALDRFEKAFTESFVLPLVHVNPGTAAIEFSRVWSESDFSLDKLLDLTPVNILSAGAAETAGKATELAAGEHPF